MNSDAIQFSRKYEWWRQNTKQYFFIRGVWKRLESLTNSYVLVSKAVKVWFCKICWNCQHRAFLFSVWNDWFVSSKVEKDLFRSPLPSLSSQTEHMFVFKVLFYTPNFKKWMSKAELPLAIYACVFNTALYSWSNCVYIWI